eukprot:GHVR01042770.1.p1 GENE.GHVR01042770.1~~GHVR01042770.1.p1  ORF type:complete len:371 (-),score=60.11 GHVR01042770.1:324-1436(-)
MTMKKLLNISSSGINAMITSANWLRQELPVRIAHRLYDFHRQPYVVMRNPHIEEVYNIYVETFEKVTTFPLIDCSEDLKKFSTFLTEQVDCHSSTVDHMGQGVREVRQVAPDLRLDQFLERFFFFRISRRIMVDHFLARQNPKPGWSGVIHRHCKLAQIIEQRSESVRESCKGTYGIAPKCVLVDNREVSIAFIPDNVAIIMTELLKNAMRATVEFYTIANSIAPAGNLVVDDNDIPEVRVEINKGKTDIVIKVSDKGGGIHPKKLERIWSYGYSTVNDTLERLVQREGMSYITSGNIINSDLAGYGFGLPLSRTLARFFGGDITVHSHFGVGTDVFVTLSHMVDIEEYGHTNSNGLERDVPARYKIDND